VLLPQLLTQRRTHQLVAQLRVGSEMSLSTLAS
jgi:hypothetical protein